MKGSFEENDAQIRRLMEQIGGAASAYEKPRPAPKPEPPPIAPKLNPFLDPEEPAPTPEEPGVAEKAGLAIEVVLDDEEDPLAQVLAQEPTWSEDEQMPSDPEEFLCATGLDEIFKVEPGVRPQTQPDPLDDSYKLHGPVWTCGELAPVWEGFTRAAAQEKPGEVVLDSGKAEIHQDDQSHWVLEDPAKDRKYLREIGNMAGSLSATDILVWVVSLSTNIHFGYLHNGWVFLLKEQL